MVEDFKVIDNYLMVKMPEEIDHHKSSYISENADRFIIGEQVNNVVFDFEDTKFMDSSGIGLIMGRSRLMRECGGNLEVRDPQPYIRRVLRLAGMERIVKIT